LALGRVQLGILSIFDSCNKNENLNRKGSLFLEEEKRGKMRVLAEKITLT
jgi:hypothetical protein